MFGVANPVKDAQLYIWPQAAKVVNIETQSKTFHSYRQL